ncbi:hypothetical protein [Halopseudomonas laoshanensis]|uniref:hypothetical protein n=1 Tax=Halopseudomonas laoshanensis TaxID=2268758 RepID=UPI003734F13C
MNNHRAQLKALASLASKGTWELDPDLDLNSSGQTRSAYFRHSTRGGRIGQTFSNCLVNSKTALANAEYIIAAQPKVVLRLIRDIETMEEQTKTLTTQIRELRQRLEARP